MNCNTGNDRFLYIYIFCYNSLIRFRENGILMRSEAIDRQTVLKETSNGSVQEIKIQQMTQVLLIPLLGILLGAIIMIIEISVWEISHKNLVKQQEIRKC